MLVITGQLTGIECTMGKRSRLRNDVEGSVWPFRWLLSSAGMALNSFKPGAKQSMHGGDTGQELQKGSGSSSYHRPAALNRVTMTTRARFASTSAQSMKMENQETGPTTEPHHNTRRRSARKL